MPSSTGRPSESVRGLATAAIGENADLRVREAAVVIGVHERTVRRAIQRGDLVAFKRDGVLYIRFDELNRYREARRSGHGHAATTARSRAKLRLVTLPAQLPTPRAPPSHAPTRRTRVPVGSLPAPLTTIVGRTQELAAIQEALVERQVRLLTLTGPGGVGKTRLAVEAANDLAESFADGVFFVTLAALVDGDLVASTVARVCGLRDTSRRSAAERLAGYLQDRHTLLVLDNFEHLLPAGPVLVGWLSAAPRLQILVTSRSRLGLTGEYTLDVPPLPVPEPGDIIPLAVIDDHAATRLFMERAQAVASGFALDDSTAGVIVEICRRLDGLPLAIELAAIHTRALPPPALLARLERRLPLLVGGPRDQPARLRTMRDALAWSYELLSIPERILFRRLAVFSGGFTYEAAAAVAWRTDEVGQISARALPPPITGIETLVSHSALTVDIDATGDPRYGMLETIREYGFEHLQAGGELTRVRDAHAAYYLSLAERIEVDLAQAVEPAHLNRLEIEIPNFRLALAWLDQTDQTWELLRLASALGPLWVFHSHRREGRQWLSRGLSRFQDAPAPLRGKALTWEGTLAHFQGDDAADLLEESLRLCQASGDTLGAGFALLTLGMARHAQDDIRQAARAFDQARECFERLDHSRGTALAYYHLGLLAYGQGDIDRAISLLSTALDRHRELLDQYGIVICLTALGLAWCDRGDLGHAAARLSEGLCQWRELGATELLTDCLAAMTALATERREYAFAARLLGKTERLAADLDHAFSLPERRRLDRAAAVIGRSLAESDLNQAMSEGRIMGETLLLKDAKELLASMMSDSVDVDDRSRATSLGLTPRELQVLRLLVEGKTNPEIAQALYISRQTVLTHVRHILTKLNAETRTAAATRAHQLGLV